MKSKFNLQNKKNLIKISKVNHYKEQKTKVRMSEFKTQQLAQ